MGLQDERADHEPADSHPPTHRAVFPRPACRSGSKQPAPSTLRVLEHAYRAVLVNKAQDLGAAT